MVIVVGKKSIWHLNVEWEYKVAQDRNTELMQFKYTRPTSDMLFKAELIKNVTIKLD